MVQAIPTTIPTKTVPIRDTLIKVISPERLISREQSDAAARKAEQDQASNEPVQNIAAHVKRCWDAAYQAKQTNVDDRLLKCLRQRLGQYDPDKLADIRRYGGSELYMMISNIKCRAAESWIRDIMLPPGEKPWDIEPTPLPELPMASEVEIIQQVQLETETMMRYAGLTSVTPEQTGDRLAELREKVQKEREERSKVVTRYQAKKIDDEFTQGGYYEALSAFINDLSTFPAAFLKGPVIRKERELTWADDGKGGFIPKIEPRLRRKYARVSPFHIYPSPGAKSVQDGYLFERHYQLRRDDLLSMLGVPGFDGPAIRAVLDQYGNVGLKDWLYNDQEREEALSRDNYDTDPDPGIDALEFWGSIQGSLLREWGMKPKQIKDPEQNYHVNLWLIGQWVIMCRLNPHPLGKRPYYSAAYEMVNDSIWGKCPPELMRDIQDICNAAARNAVNNMAIASGPQVECNMDRVDPGEDVESQYPWKVWKTRSDPTGSTGPALQFYQPNPMTEALLNLYRHFFDQASEQTGIPAYVYGSGSGNEAGGTASGLSMLMNAAGKVLKGVIKIIDDHIIKPTVREHWMHIMLYDKDDLKVGDISVVARASEHLIIQESLQIRRGEFLVNTANEIDAPIMGPSGRATVLREQARSLKLPVDDVVPPKEVMKAREEAAAQMMQNQPVEETDQNGAIPAPKRQPQPKKASSTNKAGEKYGEKLRKAA